MRRKSEFVGASTLTELMHNPAESIHDMRGRAAKLNGQTADGALLVDAPHVRLATIIEHSARGSAGRPWLWQEEQGRAADRAAADRRMNEHLAVDSHELRNSLGAIRIAARLMEINRSEPPVAEKARLVIERQAAQMARLIDDLLEVSLSRSAWHSLRRERVDLRVVARHAVESVELDIGQRNQRLTVALPEAPVWLQADPGRLEQVLVNLLGNASKYTTNGGELRLSVEHTAEGGTVRVGDSGAGIAPDVLPHVFEPFMQAESSLPRSEMGIGIGLTVVRGLAELHGGRVTAASAGLGQGSEFTVHLPATFA
jgi:signal transduction histidine kinase